MQVKQSKLQVKQNKLQVKQNKLQGEKRTSCRWSRDRASCRWSTAQVAGGVSNWGVQNRHTNAPAPLTTASVACLIGSLIASGVWRSINLGTRSTYPYVKVYSINESM